MSFDMCDFYYVSVKCILFLLWFLAFMSYVKYMSYYVNNWGLFNVLSLRFFFLNIFYWLCYYISPISPPSLHSILRTPSPHISPHSLCTCVIHINSLASTFPTLLLPSPCLFSTYHLCYLFSVPFPPLSPSHSPVDDPPCELHFCGSVPVLVVSLVCFCFCFRCDC